jgi:hypothetical protein
MLGSWITTHQPLANLAVPEVGDRFLKIHHQSATWTSERRVIENLNLSSFAGREFKVPWQSLISLFEQRRELLEGVHRSKLNSRGGLPGLCNVPEHGEANRSRE